MAVMSVILILTILSLVIFVIHLFRSWGKAEKERKKALRIKEREERMLEEMFRRDEARQQMAAAYHSHMMLRNEKQHRRDQMTQPYVVEQSFGVLAAGARGESLPTATQFQAQAPPPPGIESTDLDMIAGFKDPMDLEHVETSSDEVKDTARADGTESTKRRGKDRFIRFTSDGETVDGMSEDDDERDKQMTVLRWASDEFKAVFERPPDHLTELLEFLDRGREQSDKSKEGGEDWANQIMIPAMLGVIGARKGFKGTTIRTYL